MDWLKRLFSATPKVTFLYYTEFPGGPEHKVKLGSFTRSHAMDRIWRQHPLAEFTGESM